jgi:photosystem I subunit 11
MTVSPVADPTVGNLATPINSSSFSKAFLNALPAYRPSLSPNRRGLEVGMARLASSSDGPFAITGPLRLTEDASTSGLLATIGLVSILTVCLSLAREPPATAQTCSPPTRRSTIPPPTCSPKPAGPNLRSGFGSGGCGGAAFAWSPAGTSIVSPLGGKSPRACWSVG